MRTVQSSKVCRVLIGHSGENEAVRVQFSIEGFETEFPGGSATLYVQRFGDKDAYPVPVDVDGANAYWTVTSADSAKPGHVRCELQWVVGDTIVKSDIYGFYFLKAIDVGTEPPDEPAKRWTDRIEEKIGDLSQLETKEKSDLVSAINEAASKSGGDKTYVFTQSTAAERWEINHNLGKFPSVTIVDSGGNEVVGDVMYLTKNKLITSFTAPFSGKAYLN